MMHLYLPSREIPRWLQRLGCFDTHGSLRFRWAEFAWRRGIGLKLCLFEQGYSVMFLLGIVVAYVKVPRRLLRPREPRDMMEAWGIEITPEHLLSLKWGERYKLIEWPFCWRHRSAEVLRPDGSWIEKDWRMKEDGSYEDGRATEQHIYRYLLRSGEKQEVLATISMERYTRARRWMPWWRRVRHSIDVRFSGEVGEETGSWKGGTIGCGWEMRRGERAVDALRRMEQERRFR